MYNFLHRIQIPIPTANYRNGVGSGITIEIQISECKQVISRSGKVLLGSKEFLHATDIWDTLMVMAYLHCWTWIQVLTGIRIPILMATLYYAEYVHITQAQIRITIWTQILNRFCTHFGMDIHTRIGIRVRVR